MKLHEYQARRLFESYGIHIGPGGVAHSIEEALAIADEIGVPVVVKAQVLSGGRGKAGGVKVARSHQEVESTVRDILSLTIKDYPVQKVLIARAVNVAREFYLGIIVDRSEKKIALIASEAGGGWISRSLHGSSRRRY